MYTQQGGTRTLTIWYKYSLIILLQRRVKKKIEEEDMWMRQTHTNRRQQQRLEEETDGRQPESLSFILFPFFDNYMEI